MPELKKKEIKKLVKTAMLEDVEIFKSGVWNGDKYSGKDLERMVDNFNNLKESGKLSVPVKIGHSEKQKYLKDEGIPAAGWINKLKMVGDSVRATITDIPSKIYNIVKNKGYRKTSAEIYPQYKTSEGKNLKTVLRAVAFLGGDIPAVEGISDIINLYKDENNQDFKVYELVDEVNKYSFEVTGERVQKMKFNVGIKV